MLDTKKVSFKVGDKVRRCDFGKISTGQGVVTGVTYVGKRAAVTVLWEHGMSTYPVHRLKHYY